ncbi:hypothetical protein F5Y10DRAFT_240643 [Nemania abortiva]|nr:hypothetical protein F5Y10DRAFT_240643 [Nemania abortiva]
MAQNKMRASVAFLALFSTLALALPVNERAPVPEPDGHQAYTARTPEPDGYQAYTARTPEPDGHQAYTARAPEPDGHQAYTAKRRVFEESLSR